MEVKKLSFGLSIITALPVIPISVVTMPLVLNQPVQASDTGMFYACGGHDRGEPPCFTHAYQSGNRVIFRFGGKGWDFYNVRYLTTGGKEAQVKNRSGSFTVTNVQPNRVYTIKVQGCNSHTFGRSTCSIWDEKSVVSR